MRALEYVLVVFIVASMTIVGSLQMAKLANEALHPIAQALTRVNQ